MTPGLVAAWRRRKHLDGRRIAAALVTALLAAATGVFAASQGHGGLPLGVTLAAFVAFVLPYLLLCFSSFGRDVRLWLKGGGLRSLAAVVLVPNVVYLVYALGTDTFRLEAWARLFAFVAVPTALAAWAGRGGAPRWQDWLAIAAIWIPFDTGFLARIWAWPEGEGAYILNTALAVVLAVVLFGGWRGVSRLNLRFALSGREARLALAMFALFIAIGLPFGFATGFIGWRPRGDLAKAILTPIGILLFIGLPEELLFRGLVQNLLTQRLGRPYVALALASVFFGATHYNNTPTPDWRYLVLATVAGVFYGLTWMRTRSLLAPALVHTLVDTIWALLLAVSGWEHI